MNRLFKIITNKIAVTAFFLLSQIAFTVLTVLFLAKLSVWIYIGLSLLSLLVCLFVIGKDENPAYKLAWVVPILLTPLFGGLLYISFGRTARLSRKNRKNMLVSERETRVVYLPDLTGSKKLLGDVKESNRRLGELLLTTGGYPVYADTDVTYYPLGELFWDALKEELRTAEKYIFMEYFIIECGVCWDEIFEILCSKARDGVDVRIIYDDFGCLFTLPRKFNKKLAAAGIKTHAFNKIKPTFNIRMNNRTHRKITVIDGTVAFTGGVNLADEYINRTDRFGHWKDTAVKLCGTAAKSFAVMFLQFWRFLEHEHSPIADYLPPPSASKASGLIQPVSSDPGKNMQIIEKGLMTVINEAKSYVYINTPYLIPDNEFITSLCLAAQSGVDVRITMPHIPDKKLILLISRSFYPVLIKAGVKIYEYLPGFVHAKSSVSDDRVAYVGTCNLDYRSFYLHYECGAFMYDTPAIADIKSDYLNTLTKCKEITYDEACSVKKSKRLLQSVMRLFAPLM